MIQIVLAWILFIFSTWQTVIYMFFPTWAFNDMQVTTDQFNKIRNQSFIYSATIATFTGLFLFA